METWLPAQMQDKERKLLWAASNLIDNKTIPNCPLCKTNPLRFYYREFGIVQLGRRRGTIWVWCINCRLWDHISGVEPDETFRYSDSLSPEEFRKIDTPFLIPRLNELWDVGTLDRQVQVDDE